MRVESDNSVISLFTQLMQPTCLSTCLEAKSHTSGYPLLSLLPPTPYLTTLSAMQRYTQQRNAYSPDQIWLTEHPACYTLPERKPTSYILKPLIHPLYPTDRGGHITFHGPGQLILYTLFDLKRSPYKLKTLVSAFEGIGVAVCNKLGLKAAGNPDNRGVYLGGKKLASIGLKIKSSCTYHGMAFNVMMSTCAFEAIHPCGIERMQTTSLTHHLDATTLHTQFAPALLDALQQHFGVMTHQSTCNLT